MTVSEDTLRVFAEGNDVTTAFPFGFKYFQDSEVEVYLDGVLQSTGYTITAATSGDGGTVTFTAAPAASVQVLITRDLTLTQGASIPTVDSIGQGRLQNIADRAVMLIQQLQEVLDRALVMPRTVEDFDATLPGTLTARRAVMINTDGDGLELSTYDPDTLQAAASASVTAAANSATAADVSADAAAASATAAADSATAADVSADAAAASAAAASAIAVGVLTTKGDLVVYGTEATRLAVGTTGQVLEVDLSQSLGVKWADKETASVARSVKTSGFTAGLADKAKAFECSGSSFTMAFAAAATLGAGWYCYFTNTSAARSGYNITLDPNSTETISGASTLVLGPGSHGMIYCDGSNLFYQGVAIYESTAHSFTLNTDTSFTHNLGGIPDEADVTLVCTSTDGGYGVGDIIKGLAYVNTSSGTSYGSGIQLGATAINLLQGDGFGAYHRKTATVGAGLHLDRTKWSVYVRGKRNVR